jgi:hypothetical protein
MHASPGCLVAAGFDWLEGLLPLVFVLVWVVSQVVSVFRKAGQAARPGRPEADLPQPVRPRPARPQPAGENPAGDPAGLDREIEEFLRRTLGGERQPQPVPRPDRVPAKPRQRSAIKRPRLVTSGGPPPLPAPPPVRPARAGDGDISRHVEAAFAHDLAHESPSTTGAAVVVRPPAAAADLVAALRSPEGLRNLILMREILERPTHRW